jgi:hypothetical protein
LLAGGVAKRFELRLSVAAQLGGGGVGRLRGDAGAFGGEDSGELVGVGAQLRFDLAANAGDHPIERSAYGLVGAHVTRDYTRSSPLQAGGGGAAWQVPDPESS